MLTRMLGGHHDVYNKMMELRQERKELFVSDDDYGVFYRTQKLMYLFRQGELTLDNISQYMSIEKLSKETIPMEWYHSNDEKVQSLHTDLVVQNIALSSQAKNGRGRVTRRRLKALMYDILLKRIDKFLNPEENMKSKILCIVGESGAGKTLASLHLQNKLKANVICSFTTRPPRPTEVEGREHHFINILPDPNEMLAYADFAGYQYYALKSQVFGPCTVYVIDEQGLAVLKEQHGDEYDIHSVYITRNHRKKRASGVSLRRTKRDVGRKTLPIETYDWIIENNSTKKSLFVQIEAIYNKLIENK